MATVEEASPFNSLPNDVVQDILSRLTVKTLLTLRSVSKSLRSIISDPSFTRIHLNRQRLGTLFLRIIPNPNPYGSYPPFYFSLVRLTKDGSFQLESGNLKGPRPSWRTVVLGSCDGVLLLTNHYSCKSFMLWNPLTRSKAFFRFQYKFKPEKAIYGLVYIPGTNDFKAVIAYDNYYSVYSFDNKSWNHKCGFRYGSWNFTSTTGIWISADGVSYWLATDPVSKGVEIIYFDPRDDDFKPVGVLKEFGDVSKYWLDCVRDCLCLLYYTKFDQTKARMLKKEKGVNNVTWNVIENEDPMGILFRPVRISEKKSIVLELDRIEWYSGVINYTSSQVTLIPCRESLLLNIEKSRKGKRKQSEALELQK
ncbi:hypothetical protein CASFOL_012702 [Castilleja foliolosa]|uniref:F-box domain-containing protein n=1 Tax=Castilleja foliolosa TaxID=1961234 RepID=A0ABD3DJN1_9LAMI